MTRPIVTYGDVEHSVVDYLTARLPAVPSSVGVPDDWTPAAGQRLEVAHDGTPVVVHPLYARCTVRVVARAASTTAAKALAWRALGELLGGDTVPAGAANVRPLTGVLPARDPDTHAELASFTVQVNMRAVVA